MGQQAESRLQNRIVAALEGQGVFAVRQRLVGRAGWPDIYVVLPGCGRALHIEVKMPQAKRGTTRKQDLTLAQLQDAGALTAVVTSVDEALEFLNEAALMTSNCFWRPGDSA